MTITIKTDRYCIETAAKKRYEELLRQVLKADTNDNRTVQLETSIETLKTFLENADMSILRRSYPELDKGGDTEVALRVDNANDQITLTFQGKVVTAPLKEDK